MIFGGYAVLNKRKLVGYLNRSNSITCNLLSNELNGSNINISLEDKDIVSFGVFDSKTKYDFNFNGENLSEVVIKNEMKVNYEEVRTKEDISDEQKINDLQQKISEETKKEIERVIAKMKEYNCDFINIKEAFKIKHPYKYEKMKDNWTEQVLNAKFTIENKTVILRTYDVLQVK